MAAAMQLIDQHMPEWQFQERHALWVKGAAASQLFEAIEPALKAPDPLIDSAIALRELPGRLLQRLGWGENRLPTRPFGHDSFTRLAQTPGQEVVFGLAGHFWRLDYGLVKFTDAEAFAQLQAVPKLVLDVRLEPAVNGCTLLTRTRVHCPDETSRRRFAPYWYLIRPVSGVIRRRLLNRIRSLAQAVS